MFTQAFPKLNFGGLLNYGKLRGGWSRVGNDADPYHLAVTYTAQSQFGDIPRFTTPNSLQNPMLKPENTDAWEVGTEMQWFDNRVGLDLSYYTKKTSNQILTADVSKASGFDKALVNAGVISNRGVEAQVSLVADPLVAHRGVRVGHDGELRLEPQPRRRAIRRSADGAARHRSGICRSKRARASPTARCSASAISATRRRTRSCSATVCRCRSRRATSACSATTRRIGRVVSTTRSTTEGFDFGFLFDTRRGGNVYSVGNMWGSYSGVLATTAYRPDSGLLIKGIDKATGKENTVHVRTEDYYHSLYPIQEAWIYDASFVKLREARFGFNVPPRLLRTTSIKRRTSRSSAATCSSGRTRRTSIRRRRSAPTNVQGFEMGQMPTVRSFGFQLSVTP